MPDDAALVQAVAAGDRAALGLIYDRYASQLLGFCMNLLHHRTDAEDCLQDVFVIAAARLPGLREPDRLRSWLFAVARHECFARIDRRRREIPVDEVPEPPPPPPVEPVPSSELAGLLEDALAGLTDRERLLLELADRRQLSGEEVAAAVGVPRSTAYTLVARARTTARRSIGALLVARSGREQCPELDRLLTGWDGELTPLLRKQIARHVERCATCSARRDRVAVPAVLLGETPAFAAELVSLRLPILAAAAAGAAPVEEVRWAGDWPPPDPVLARQSRRRRGLLAALLLGGLLLLGGVVVAVVPDGGSHHHPIPVASSGRVSSAPLIADPGTQAVAGGGSPASSAHVRSSARAPHSSRAQSASASSAASSSVVGSASSSVLGTSAQATQHSHAASSSAAHSSSTAGGGGPPPPPAAELVLTWSSRSTPTLTAVVSAGSHTYQCVPEQTCQWSIPEGTAVTITAYDQGTGDYDTYQSSTATCTAAEPPRTYGVCGFTLTSATTFVLSQTTT